MTIAVMILVTTITVITTITKAMMIRGTTMMTMIIPAWVCLMIFIFGGVIIGMIGAFAVWDL